MTAPELDPNGYADQARRMLAQLAGTEISVPERIAVAQAFATLAVVDALKAIAGQGR